MNGLERIVQLIWALGGYLALAALCAIVAAATGMFESIGG